MISSLLWRLWKWLLHIATGKCEINRLALWSAPLYQKTWSIRRSLMHSRHKSLVDVVWVSGLAVSDALTVVTSVKKIPPAEHEQFESSLRPCLLRIRSVRALLADLEEVRGQPFSQENSKHEEMLMELWSMLYPSVELEERITKQWQDIGFQGNNPSTDFRGMGMLGLVCLHYFSRCHGDRACSTLSHSHHPQYGYPYAIVVINIASLALGWLRDGQLDQYLYRTCEEWPLSKDVFTEIVCSLIVRFDDYWMKSKPENVMAFPAVREAFAEELSTQLLNSDSLCLALS